MLAHAPEEAERAALVAEKLESLGFQISTDAAMALSPFERKRLRAEIEQAACVLVLWSRGAADDPVLKAAAAHAAGKLKLARLDAAQAPARAGWASAADLSAWRGLARHRDWSRLVAALRAHTPPAKIAPKPVAPAAPPAAKVAVKPAALAAAAPAAPAPTTSSAELPKKSGGAVAAVVALALAAAIGAGVYLFLM